MASLYNIRYEICRNELTDFSAPWQMPFFKAWKTSAGNKQKDGRFSQGARLKFSIGISFFKVKRLFSG